MAIIVIPERCPQNHPCPAVKSCPVDALTQSGMSAPDVDTEACVECGQCVEVCPRGALQLPDNAPK